MSVRRRSIDSIKSKYRPDCAELILQWDIILVLPDGSRNFLRISAMISNLLRFLSIISFLIPNMHAKLPLRQKQAGSRGKSKSFLGQIILQKPIGTSLLQYKSQRTLYGWAGQSCVSTFASVSFLHELFQFDAFVLCHGERCQWLFHRNFHLRHGCDSSQPIPFFARGSSSWRFSLSS